MAADIKGAVAVPVTLFAVMVAVVVLLVTQVLPVFDRVFAQLGVRMGAVVGAVADILHDAGALLAAGGKGGIHQLPDLAVDGQQRRECPWLPRCGRQRLFPRI